ncbi:hypothetical protein J4206_07650 [Candidatus Woesearchaeota archaeon]|nr:hypothetical protein [Candidatus Woesearchaeota archaeon]
MKKNIISWVIAAVVLSAFIGFFYYSIPHVKPVPASHILKNPDDYRNKAVMVEGTPVIRSSVSTKYGKYAFFAIKDETGQIPVSRDVYETYVGSELGIVGEVGDVCVHGTANETSGKWACDKKETGIVT